MFGDHIPSCKWDIEVRYMARIEVPLRWKKPATWLWNTRTTCSTRAQEIFAGETRKQRSFWLLETHLLPPWQGSRLPKGKSTCRWWFQILFFFTPTWGRLPFWLIIFQMGWFNHQLEIIFQSSIFRYEKVSFIEGNMQLLTTLGLATTID